MLKQKREMQNQALRITRIYFAFIASYISAIIIFDSWNLITHEAVAWRWTAAGLFMIANTICWYIAKTKVSLSAYRAVMFTLILSSIALASFTVYWERGVDSIAVGLFAIPIMTSAILKSRTILLATATLSAAAYTTAAVVYFNKYYGEGYRVELYGTIIFYSSIFYILVALIRVAIKTKD